LTHDQIVAGELDNIKIPARPAVLLNLQREMGVAEPDFQKIEEIITMDVAISASLVKIANNPTLGLSRQVRSIKEALHLLGLSTVRTVVMAIALRQSFAKTKSLERFWDSSARIAHLTSWLAANLVVDGRKIRPDEAFTFGLFRDCGIAVLMSMYADYLEILARANAESQHPFTSIEVDELGLDHAMIGGMLVREWELPEEFRQAVERHHEVEAIEGTASTGISDTSRILIALAQLAEHLFQALTGLNKTCEWQKLGGSCLTVLELTEANVAELLAQANTEGIHKHPMI
jgi:HD-like signal output (HDOD) protein